MWHKNAIFNYFKPPKTNVKVNILSPTLYLVWMCWKNTAWAMDWVSTSSHLGTSDLWPLTADLASEEGNPIRELLASSVLAVNRRLHVESFKRLVLKLTLSCHCQTRYVPAYWQTPPYAPWFGMTSHNGTLNETFTFSRPFENLSSQERTRGLSYPKMCSD